ncbi:MAG: sugar phosphate nucleotidyltransferase [Flavobacteriales bacterium]|nr:sugar phosphate nucleotidyltransferase [Flavobacteriales bacterium]
MNIIIPMAGRGSRLRPHTLTTPKPLISFVGKSIVQRLVEDIVAVCDEKIDEIAFIIGDFGDEVVLDLKRIASNLGAKGIVVYQEEPLGTAHAILCAKESLKGNVVVAFADTLFRADFKLNKNNDGIIWVSKIDDPSAFGVVKINKENIISDFVEKPQEYISDLAIIGIYYFNDGENLKSELQYLIDNNIKDKGEYQLTNALENMKNKGSQFSIGQVDEWLDCGNKEATIYTSKRVLEHNKQLDLIDKEASIKNSEIISPCYIGPGTKIENSKIGPHVSIGANTNIKDSHISSSIIQNESTIVNSKLNHSMIGNKVFFNGNNINQEISLGDFCEIK